MNQNSEDNQELDKAIGALVKITNRSPEEIKLHLEKFLAQLSQNPTNLKNHFFETATDDEWVSALFSWSQSHKSQKLPVLSEEAMSRESMYPDRW
jgi:hypothetical protein